MGISVKNIVVRAWLGGAGNDPKSGCDFGSQVKKGWETLEYYTLQYFRRIIFFTKQTVYIKNSQRIIYKTHTCT